MLRHEEPQQFEQFDLPPQRFLLGAQHLPLPLVERGSRVTLRILDCLLAYVVVRHLPCLGATHLEKEAKHPVEANLQRRDACPFDLLRLIPGDPCLAARRQFHQLIQAGIKAGPNEAAIPGKHRAALPQGLSDAPRQGLARVDVVTKIGKQAGAVLQQRDHVGQDRRRPTDPLKITRARAARDHTAGEPLQVADAGEFLCQSRSTGLIRHQRRHRIEPAIDLRLIDQRRRKPLHQQAGSHRRLRAVDNAGQRSLTGAGHHRPHQLQAAARSLVDFHPVAGTPGRKHGDAGDGRGLVLLQVCHDAAGRCDARKVARQIEAHTLQTLLLQCPPDRGLRRGGIEPPVGAAGDRAARRQKSSADAPHDLRDNVAVLLGAEAFRGLKAEQDVGDIVAGHDRRLEPARCDVDPRQAHDHAIDLSIGGRVGHNRHQPVAFRRVEQRFVRHDAGRDDPRHLAAQQALGGLGIVDLFADCHAAARGDELHQLHVELVMRKAGHRLRVGPLFTAGEREIEQGGGLAGVIPEELVEITHAKQHERPRAPGFRGLKLLHHW